MKTPIERIKNRGGSPAGYVQAVRMWGCGFTLLELLVVVGTIAILTAMATPVYCKAKAKAQRVVCMNNQKQLAMIWELYPQDNNEVLVDNGAWVRNNLNHVSDCVNPGLMLDPTKSLFASYLRTTAVYWDPSSRHYSRTGDAAPAEQPLPRNYALNCWVGPSQGYTALHQKLALAGPCRQPTKLAEITSPGPSLLMTFQDLNPDSICSPFFGVFVTPPGAERISHYPATYHDGRGVITFADGHVETHRWVDPRSFSSTLSYHFGPDGHNHPSPGNPDMLWLQEHATSLIQ